MLVLLRNKSELRWVNSVRLLSVPIIMLDLNSAELLESCDQSSGCLWWSLGFAAPQNNPFQMSPSQPAFFSSIPGQGPAEGQQLFSFGSSSLGGILKTGMNFNEGLQAGFGQTQSSQISFGPVHQQMTGACLADALVTCSPLGMVPKGPSNLALEPCLCVFC